ncbi:MAG: bifunctional phosphoglucose/phosphomannose isomerase [Candidatus Rokubacteria bacterium]|nr:bifunctional phosphoglucose/phosphomannose isomerase [Candidatus Rokubacteria bacterium]
MLDDQAALERVDAHATRDVLAAFPAQCRTAAALHPEPAPPGIRPRAVIAAGMGGSAAGGDVVAACALERLDVPIVVHRGYGLPALARPDTLVVASSYSGETAEVVSALETALARGVPAVAITSGGRLARLAEQARVPRVALPGGLMPRMALGFLVFPLLATLDAVGLTVASEAEIAEALGALDALAGVLGPARGAASNEAKQLALAIGDAVPVIYGGPLTGASAYRWKTDLEENAKTFALSGTLPEMNHNEIEAWRAPAGKGLHLVLLRDRDEGGAIARRFALVREMCATVAAGVSEVWGRGEGPLARLLSLAYLGQWTSYYLAILRGEDPWLVPTLEALKSRMASDERR